MAASGCCGNGPKWPVKSQKKKYIYIINININIDYIIEYGSSGCNFKLLIK